MKLTPWNSYKGAVNAVHATDMFFALFIVVDGVTGESSARRTARIS